MTATQSDLMQSASVTIQPCDTRCRYWAKIIRKGTSIPKPVAVEGAADVPGHYLRQGDDELYIGDVLIEGEENHHRKLRGWTYDVTFVDKDGELRTVHPCAEIKSALKAGGLPPELLAGSGDVAACVRIAHAVALGIQF